MSLDRKPILKVALTGLLFAAIFAVSLNRRAIAISAYLSLALACALIVYAVIRRSGRELLWVVGGGLFVAALDYGVINSRPMFMTAFAFVSLGTVAVLGTRTIWAEREDRRLLLCCFVPPIPVVGLDWIAPALHHITEVLHPKTFDLFLYSFDCSLWVQPSFLMGQVLDRWGWLRFACLLIYNTLPLPLALVYAAQLRRNKQAALVVMLVFVVTGPIGILFYNLLPACGPVHVFQAAFPWHPLSIAEAMRVPVEPILLKGVRNAIPSLHMAWVLLVWWNSWGLARWIRAIALFFVVLTVMATLGTGEHYVIDLVVAFPFSLMVQALCSYRLPLRTGERRTALLFGVFVTLAWLALLSYAIRFFWISPVVPWAMMVATVVPSVALWQRLLRAGTQEQPAPLRVAAAGANA